MQEVYVKHCDCFYKLDKHGKAKCTVCGELLPERKKPRSFRKSPAGLIHDGHTRWLGVGVILVLVALMIFKSIWDSGWTDASMPLATLGFILLAIGYALLGGFKSRKKA